MSAVSAVFFDFDGVLCTDRFYSALMPDYPHVLDFIGENVFSGEKYADRWMRGEFTYRQINGIIAEATKFPLEQLNELFITSVRQMKINPVVINIAEKLKKNHIKTAIVTGNMDIFNEITVPEKQLDKTFPVIINSYDYRILKQDENGRLFDIALDKLGLESYEGVLLIDDSAGYCDIFKEKGGDAYQYSNQKDFESWAKSCLPLIQRGKSIAI
jgi:FMN phosphatase YigB (HAD superfamily)